jgi:cytochrome c-type protein NapC
MAETPLRWFWQTLRRPAVGTPLGALLLVGLVVGMAASAGFSWSLNHTSTESFCIGCHDMKDNAYREYSGTVHAMNRTGVRVTCSDCHLSDQLGPKLMRKVRASNEVLQNLLGTIDTREKYEAHRLEMARSVWAEMKANDSRQCRNCHDALSMDLARQSAEARDRHADGEREGKTCIDCHQGIAHQLPAGVFPDGRGTKKVAESGK